MDLREIGFDGVDWICLAQGRELWQTLVNTVMNLRVHYCVLVVTVKGKEFLALLSILLASQQ
jgi:hypothetical protein